MPKKNELQITAETHPLHWGDREIVYMLSHDTNPTVIYRLMGYHGKRPNRSFLERLERLRSTL